MELIRRLLGRRHRPSPQEARQPPRVRISEKQLWSPGDRLPGGWAILDIIDSGGMGTVFVVADPASGRPRAAKTFKERFLANLHNINRFKEEAETWIQLGRHANIVKADFVQEIEGRPFIFLEYVPGGNLRELMMRTLSLQRTLGLLIQLCAGMAYVHNKKLGRGGLGLLHCDLKPENMLIAPGDILKITDFGLAMVFNDDRSLTEAVPVDESGDIEKTASNRIRKKLYVGGTPLYMSPEQFLGPDSLGYHSDIYSFGVVFFEILAGRRPFQPKGNSRQEMVESLRLQHLNSPPPSLRSLQPHLPESLEAIAFDCLQKSPGRRPPSFDSLEVILREIFRDIYKSDFSLDISAEDNRLESLRLASSFVSLGKSEQAIPHCDEAIGVAVTDGEIADALNVKGLAYSNIGRIEEALEIFGQALRLKPLLGSAWNNKGNAYWRIEDFVRAIECYDKALEIFPGDWETSHNMGAVLDTLGRHEEALEWFDRVLRINPKHVNSLASKGNVLQKMGRYQEAMGCLDRALEINPRDANALHNKIVVYVKLAQFDSALEWSNRLIELDVHHPEYWYGRAVILARKQLYDQAVQTVEEGFVPARDKVRMLELKLAILIEIIKMRAEPRYHRALYETIERILEIEPAHSAANRVKAELEGDPTPEDPEVSPLREAKAMNLQGEAILNMKGDIGSAVDLFMKAIEIEPQLMDSYNNMGVAMEMTGRVDEAIAFYDRALELEPNFHMPWYNKGNCYKGRGEFEKALACYERALELNSKFVNSWVNKGYCLMRLGRLGMARNAYEQALSLDPGNPMALNGLGFL